MMAKHTPGPWWVTNNGVRSHGGYIAHTNSVMRYEGQEDRYAFEVAQRDADKALIAASPALLAACKKARDFLQSIAYNTDEMDALDAAIAAAEGEV